MKQIEVEVRSFIDKKKYEFLMDFFNKNGVNTGSDHQETYYYDGEHDLRIQKSKVCSKVWLKKGQMHDECREEIEIKSDTKDFENLEKLYQALGYKVKIKWFRDRTEFEWKGTKISLDYTRGYGYIVELERMADPKDKDAELEMIKSQMKELGITITPKQEFADRFKDYEKNWERLTRE